MKTLSNVLDSTTEQTLDLDSLAWLDLTLRCEQELGLTLPAAMPSGPLTPQEIQEQLRPIEHDQCGVDPIIGASSTLSAEQLKALEPPRWSLPLQPFIYAGNYLAMKLIGRVKVEGAHRVDWDSPAIFCPNHVSYLDAFFMSACTPYRALKNSYWAAIAEIAFSSPAASAFSRASQMMPIDGEGDTRTTLALAAAQLERGGSLGWFPEGQRGDGKTLCPLMGGLGRLLSLYPRVVVPVAIRGADHCWPKDRKWPRLSKVTVEFLDPVHSTRLAEEGEGETEPQRITHALEQRMRVIYDFK